MQFDKFHSVLNLFWKRWFSEAQYDVQKDRQARLEKLCISSGLKFITELYM